MIARLTIEIFGRRIFEALVEQYADGDLSDGPTRTLGESAVEIPDEPASDDALRLGFA